VKGLEEKVDGGLFVDKEGKVLGKHRGYPFYTIGQRRGLELALGEPMYVTGIHPDTNTVTLGLAEDLLKTKMSVRGLNLIKYAELPETMEAMVKVRYKHPGSKALVEQRNGDLTVNFYEEVSAIAPGQSAVFYEGDDVIGGGFIKKDH
jgi:tRNA-specific 2-thiouridylase